MSPTDHTIFERVARLRSFTRAADELGISRATASQRVATLEERLGVQLLHRTTRVVRPTPLGAAFAERCAAILAELKEAELAVTAAAPVPHGVLRLSCPRLFGAAFLPPLLTTYRRAFPQVDIELALTERHVDLVEEGFDLAIRLGPLPDSSLRARRLGEARLALFASPRRQVSEPDRIEWIAIGPSRRTTLPTLAGPMRIQGTIAVDSLEMARDLAAAGLGVTMLPAFLADDLVREGRLHEVLPQIELPALPISAVFPAQRQLSARVRQFLDLLVDWADDPPW